MYAAPCGDFYWSGLAYYKPDSWLFMSKHYEVPRDYYGKAYKVARLKSKRKDKVPRFDYWMEVLDLWMYRAYGPK